MGKIKAKGQFHQIKNEDTGVSSTDLQDYTDHTVHKMSFFSDGHNIYNILYTV